MADEESSNPSVEKAMSQGWVPLEDWEAAGKPKDDWVDHGEFNYRGELMGRISSQSRELKELRGVSTTYDNKLKQLGKALEMLSNQNKALAKNKLKEEKIDLRRIRAEAEAEGDHETVASVDEDLETLKVAEADLDATSTIEDMEEGNQAADGQLTPEQAQEFKSWVEQNPWYVTNPSAANYANFVATTIPKEGKTYGEYLSEVGDAVSAVFKNETAPTSGSGPGQRVVEPGANGGRGAARNSAGASSLSDLEKDIGRTFVQDGTFKSLEEYAKHLNEGN